MHPKLKRFPRVVAGIALYFAIFLAWFKHELFDNIATRSLTLFDIENSAASLFFANLTFAILLATACLFAERAAEFSIAHWRLVRRILLWKQDIEGEWLAILFNEWNHPITRAETYVEFTPDGYKISGTDYMSRDDSEALIDVGGFRTTVCALATDSLFFRYIEVREGKEGYGLYRFHFRRDDSEFTGHFVADTTQESFTVFGRQKNKFAKEWAHELRLIPLEHRREWLLKKFYELYNEAPTEKWKSRTILRHGQEHNLVSYRPPEGSPRSKPTA